MKTVIHVNQHKIKSNEKLGLKDPVLTCKTYRSNLIGNTIIIKSNTGEEVGRFVYSPAKPLPCGAKVWFETHNQVSVLE